MAGDRKRPGCCTLCDAEVFAVKATDAAGDPLRFGAPQDNALRAHLLLTDGTVAATTLCASCLPKAPFALPKLWRRTLAAFAFERGRRGAHPSRPHHTPAQIQAEHRHLATMASNVPLGILAVEKWSEVRHG